MRIPIQNRFPSTLWVTDRSSPSEWGRGACETGCWVPVGRAGTRFLLGLTQSTSPPDREGRAQAQLVRQRILGTLKEQNTSSQICTNSLQRVRLCAGEDPGDRGTERPQCGSQRERHFPTRGRGDKARALCSQMTDVPLPDPLLWSFREAPGTDTEHLPAGLSVPVFSKAIWWPHQEL